MTLLLGAFVLALAPISAAEHWLVPRYSSQQLQMKAVDYSIQQSRGVRLLLAGDSTIRNLHVRASDMDVDPEFTNVGIGGTGAKEWYYAVRNALRSGRGVRAIVVGMAKGHGMFDFNPVPLYYPFLLDLSDIKDEYRAGRIGLEQAGRLLLNSRFRLLCTKEDVLQGVVSKFFPDLSRFMMDQVLHQQQKERELKARIESPLAPEGQYDALERLVRLADANGTKLFFVLSPTSERERMTSLYQGGAALFRAACKDLSLRCEDFSARVPDRYFSADGVHLREEFANAYKELIENLLN